MLKPTKLTVSPKSTTTPVQKPFFYFSKGPNRAKAKKSLDYRQTENDKSDLNERPQPQNKGGLGPDTL